ncbi:hypothetical protein [Actinacidiphila bryophytorum]|uniref:hypothetical protein n=1 Tax=Actinacidiphila bryophytorum TaxID=1436133 RepID=UPI002176DB7F|nr:hypothetical protein [Actinacidiphila bryophytorum]UWE08587.1 hypothetical protein NYE86_07545 [Actinacidiphila bryophytorum]
MPRVRRRGAGVVLAVMLCLVPAAGAGYGGWYWWQRVREDDASGRGDAPVAARQGEDSAVTVYNMPDGFGNVATKCVGAGQRGYSTTHFDTSDGDDTKATNASIVVVPDPACR